MAEEACCTCAAFLSTITPEYDSKTEKPVAHDRRLDCCGRVICGKCISENSRFGTYCPFCQISSTLSSIPQGLHNPPAYSPPPSPRLVHATLAHPRENNSDLPPSYNSLLCTSQASNRSEKSSSTYTRDEQAPDVLHFLAPIDTLQSLSLAYNTPITALRRTNRLNADHLLAARRTILIPGEYYKGGVSLSPRPLLGEEEEIRQGKVRRWMVGCKVAEWSFPSYRRYDIALLYLKQVDYDLDAAIAAYKADEKWEKENPMNSKVRGKTPQKRVGGMGMTGQLG